MQGHRIRCEVCEKQTTKGIIEKDNALRDRHFCSDKCLQKKLKEQKKDGKELEETKIPFLFRIFGVRKKDTPKKL